MFKVKAKLQTELAAIQEKIEKKKADEVAAQLASVQAERKETGNEPMQIEDNDEEREKKYVANT